MKATYDMNGISTNLTLLLLVTSIKTHQIINYYNPLPGKYLLLLRYKHITLMLRL